MNSRPNFFFRLLTFMEFFVRFFKAIFSLLIFALVFAFLFYLFSVASHAAPLDTGFEVSDGYNDLCPSSDQLLDGTIGNDTWGTYSNNQYRARCSAVDHESYTGDQLMEITNAGAGNSVIHLNGFDVVENGVLTYFFSWSNDGNNDHGVLFYDDTVFLGEVFLAYDGYAGGKEHYIGFYDHDYNIEWLTAAATSQGQYYRIEVIWDTSDNSLTARVDDGAWSDPFIYASLDSGVDDLRFSHGAGSGGAAQYDDFSIEDLNPPPTPFPTGYSIDKSIASCLPIVWSVVDVSLSNLPNQYMALSKLSTACSTSTTDWQSSLLLSQQVNYLGVMTDYPFVLDPTTRSGYTTVCVGLQNQITGVVDYASSTTVLIRDSSVAACGGQFLPYATSSAYTSIADQIGTSTQLALKVCTLDQWKNGNLFERAVCSAGVVFMQLGNIVASWPLQAVSSVSSQLQGLFPVNVPVRVYNAWQQSSTSTVPVALQWITPTMDDGDISLEVPFFKGSSEVSTTSAVVFGRTIFTAGAFGSAFANIRAATTYLLWVLFIFWFLFFSRSVWDELNP